ncbi:MAG: hypothetical protein ACRDSP_16870 [Pseudonocardiaceae bacterium]
MAVARYRERWTVARSTSDRADAMALAHILRTDIHAHRPLPADSELAQAIAVLARRTRGVVPKLCRNFVRTCASTTQDSSPRSPRPVTPTWPAQTPERFWPSRPRRPPVPRSPARGSPPRCAVVAANTTSTGRRATPRGAAPAAAAPTHAGGEPP